MVLSKPEILKHLKAGNIVIDPFNEQNVANTSYDVRLGPYFFRQSGALHGQTFNPFSEASTRQFYQKAEQAIAVSKLKSKHNPLQNLKPHDRVILIAPNETILAHTLEFIGGLNGDPTKKLPAITTEMRARSSMGRIGIAVCKCAGWGDIGYINRWTMEITNFSNATIALPVGLRVAQFIFHETNPVTDADFYARKGKYQMGEFIGEIKKSWRPEMMLPQLYKDKDLGRFSEFYE